MINKQLGRLIHKYTLLFLFSCSMLFGFSQTIPSNSDSVLIDGIKYKTHKVGKATFIIKNSGDTLYLIVETMPKFPGGEKAMFEFLGANVKYPPEAKANNINGKIYISFVISKEGNIEGIKVLRGVHSILDNEAIRVVKAMPKWIPGTQEGKPVNVSYNLPINFVLRGVSAPNGPNPRSSKSQSKGNKFFAKKDFSKAITHYTEAIKWYPNYKNAFYQRAMCYAQLKDMDKACKDWKKCTELGDPRVLDSINKYCN